MMFSSSGSGCNRLDDLAMRKTPSKFILFILCGLLSVPCSSRGGFEEVWVWDASTEDALPWGYGTYLGSLIHVGLSDGSALIGIKFTTLEQVTDGNPLNDEKLWACVINKSGEIVHEYESDDDVNYFCSKQDYGLRVNDITRLPHGAFISRGEINSVPSLSFIHYPVDGGYDVLQFPAGGLNGTADKSSSMLINIQGGVEWGGRETFINWDNGESRPIHTTTNLIYRGYLLTPNEATSMNDQQIDIDDDGSRLLVGNVNNQTNITVQVYDQLESIWEQVGTSIDLNAGGSVSELKSKLSANGERVAIGFKESETNSVVKVFEFDGSDWSQVGDEL